MKKENNKIVSVIIRVYNRTDFVCDAIKSLLDQTYEELEILVVDDGSSINVGDFIKNKCPSPKIRVINKPHSGLSATLNEGIRNARGDYLIFLDDDDILHPQMISTAFAAMKGAGVDMVTVGYKYFGENAPLRNSEQFLIPGKEKYLHVLMSHNPFPINSVLIRSSVVRDEGYFDETMEGCEDWDLWLRLVAKGIRMETVQKCLSFIRVHNKNASRNLVAMHLGRLKVLKKAKTYLNKEFQKTVNLRRRVAYRMLVAGWFLLLDKRAKDGRKMILASANENLLFIFPSLILSIISHFPVFLLKRLTYYATLLAESIFKTGNIQSYKNIYNFEKRDNT